MLLQIMPGRFAVSKIKKPEQIPWQDQFVFVGQTDAEFSLVCREEFLPADIVACEKGWRGLRIAGELDFSLIGILAPIAQLLAQAKISIFVVSSFDTDYALLKEAQFAQALALLQQNGYQIEEIAG